MQFGADKKCAEFYDHKYSHKENNLDSYPEMTDAVWRVCS